MADGAASGRACIGVRKRVRVIGITEEEVTLKLVPEQGALIRECLYFLHEAPEDALCFFVDASSGEILQLARRFDREESREYVLGVRGLRLAYLSLSHALSQFSREEDFHTRIGWYRDDARDLAAALWVALADNSVDGC
ncbi:cadherin repeat domain-containing protein [Streptomyces sp. HNM0574]|uniref:cadherin repeat domain-containing protein n=1 Tax=Streptomyces sp. HNM0574 TaxID=2714954 RepID=UPI00146AB772|nr:cadherin repeat domain-containing protein [Streptomyces sp. HNM0574]NLU66676.1 cadherin repeat domain-containing protein [Streptomyces sp. HNM0574]